MFFYPMLSAEGEDEVDSARLVRKVNFLKDNFHKVINLVLDLHKDHLGKFLREINLVLDPHKEINSNIELILLVKNSKF
jgi:hypothetical protein